MTIHKGISGIHETVMITVEGTVGSYLSEHSGTEISKMFRYVTDISELSHTLGTTKQNNP